MNGATRQVVVSLRAIEHTLALCGIAALLSSCSMVFRPAPADPAPPEVPRVLAYSTRQVDMGGSVRFVRCTDDCDRPTLKTLPGDRIAQASSSMPVPGNDLHLSTSPVHAVTAAQTEPLRLSVAFERDTAVLSTAEQARLRALHTEMQAAAVIRIEGRTDSGGAQAANDHIADARALTVMLFVRDQVLSPEGRRPELRASAKGRCCYLASNRTEQGRRANRRAEITVEPFEATNAASFDGQPSTRQ